MAPPVAAGELYLRLFGRGLESQKYDPEGGICTGISELCFPEDRSVCSKGRDTGWNERLAVLDASIRQGNGS